MKKLQLYGIKYSYQIGIIFKQIYLTSICLPGAVSMPCRGDSVSVSLLTGISTFVGYFNVKSVLLEEQQCYYLTHSWEDKGVHTFPMGICPKVNVITRLEFELVYYDFAVHRFNHYTTRTPPPRRGETCWIGNWQSFI